MKSYRSLPAMFTVALALLAGGAYNKSLAQQPEPIPLPEPEQRYVEQREPGQPEAERRAAEQREPEQRGRPEEWREEERRRPEDSDRRSEPLPEPERMHVVLPEEGVVLDREPLPEPERMHVVLPEEGVLLDREPLHFEGDLKLAHRFVVDPPALAPTSMDLVPVNSQSQLGGLGYCTIDKPSKKLAVTVRNAGTAAAAASMATVQFYYSNSVQVSVPSIPAGGTVKVLVAIPSGSFKPDAPFQIKVDSAGQVNEVDETNNTAKGYCIG
jgi:CARDB protein